MKKIFLAALLLVSSFSFSQQEIKIDLADALIMKTLEVSYEYYISDENSVGISALFNFESRNADLKYDQKRVFTPYFRQYFSKDKEWNVFGELFVGINSGEKEVEDAAGAIVDYENYTDGALGVAVGTKYVAGSGITFEAYGGLGRNLFASNSHTVVPRVGFNIGYRF